MSHPSERDIVTALAQGNREAFLRLYNRHVTLLLNYGISITKSRELVKDCVQDLFLTIWQRRETLGEIESMQAYLLTSLRRLIIYKLKKQDKTGIREQEYSAGGGDETIEETIIRAEGLQFQQNTILEKVEALPPRQREVIFLRFFAEMSYEEIGQLMELNYQGVRNLVYKAISSLRNTLRENDQGIILLLIALVMLMST